MHNLLILLADVPGLRSSAVLAGSGRIARDTRAQGFTAVIVADDPGDASMLAALLHWRQES
ncbi:MAG: hypothetical protein R3E89_01880 [Thiolinea sp.]